MAQFFPLAPNWNSGLRETYSFLTDIFTSEDGTEQRRSERIRPRRKLEFNALLDGDRRRVFGDTLAGSLDGTGSMADFAADPAYIVAEESNIYSLDRVPPWLVLGAKIAVVTNRWVITGVVDTMGDYEYDPAEYDDSFGGNIMLTFGPIVTAGGIHVDVENVTLLDGVSFDGRGFSAGMSEGYDVHNVLSGPEITDGAMLLPVVNCRFGASSTLTFETNDVATTGLAFDIVPEADARAPDATPRHGAAGIFRNRYVLLTRPNFLKKPTASLLLPYETVDYERGVVKSFNSIRFLQRTLSATYLGIGRGEVNALLDIFLRARGRAGEIMVPTWGNDIPPVVGVTGGGSLVVMGRSFYDIYRTDTSHRNLLLHTQSGVSRPMLISTMSLNADENTVITFATPVPYTAANVIAGSWLFVARFAQDSLTVEWLTTEHANVAFSFTTLANVNAETGFGHDWSLSTGYFNEGTWTAAAEWPTEIDA